MSDCDHGADVKHSNFVLASHSHPSIKPCFQPSQILSLAHLTVTVSIGKRLLSTLSNNHRLSEAASFQPVADVSDPANVWRWLCDSSSRYGSITVQKARTQDS